MPILHGTRPTKPDHRDFSYPRTYGSVSQFPDAFNLDPGLTMPDQNADGFPYGCTGYTQAEICGDEDKVRYQPKYTYDKTRLIEGTYPQPVGCDIRDALKTTITYGVLREDETTDNEAGYHRRGAYFSVVDSADKDAFDDVRSAILMNNRSVSCGTPWFLEWHQAPNGILHDFVPRGDEPWHNWKICGWKQINGQPYLIGKTWQGPRFGDQGWCYISRALCNKIFAINGTAAFTVRKAVPADIETVRLNIFSTVLSYLRMLLASLLSKPATTPPEARVSPVAPTLPPPAPTLPPTIPESETLRWDTPQNAWHAVRVLCDEAGLSVGVKNIICACIYQESRFLNTAKNENTARDGELLSTDWGICQINDFYHVGPGKDFASVAILIAHPEEAVRFMIEMYQSGKLDLWVSYSSGAYKMWLSPASPMWALAG